MFYVFPTENYFGNRIPVSGRKGGGGNADGMGRSGIQGLGFAASDRGVATRGYFGLHKRRERVRHLCVASANCAR